MDKEFIEQLKLRVSRVKNPAALWNKIITEKLRTEGKLNPTYTRIHNMVKKIRSDRPPSKRNGGIPKDYQPIKTKNYYKELGLKQPK